MIKSKKEFEATMERIEQLLPLVKENMPKEDCNLIELDLLTTQIEE